MCMTPIFKSKSTHLEVSQIFSPGFGGGLSEISESKGEKKEDRVRAARVGFLRD